MPHIVRQTYTLNTAAPVMAYLPGRSDATAFFHSGDSVVVRRIGRRAATTLGQLPTGLAPPNPPTDVDWIYMVSKTTPISTNNNGIIPHNLLTPVPRSFNRREHPYTIGEVAFVTETFPFRAGEHLERGQGVMITSDPISEYTKAPLSGRAFTQAKAHYTFTPVAEFFTVYDLTHAELI
ncbi:hypothetical protein BDQ12DRAFT_670732 [Crucibulum laeve]|uniref:Uncharacterized protein n=1 Tax=Crucibulum laeve TaxID=68775 RepID=A0A5C3LJY6_9AGAR|nr:hypothetical protein BDQ12DRAFT_670732 [Crucibulum laeve]